VSSVSCRFHRPHLLTLTSLFPFYLHTIHIYLCTLGEEALDEARMLARIDSPYVIRYYDCFIEGLMLNIVMEYAAKGSLHQMIKVAAKATPGRALPEEKVWRIFIQTLMGLSHIHSRRIIHR
jgi:NIMA (never in mitosis gene a)-related kinase 1/4/5